jgi:hypothetical protein
MKKHDLVFLGTREIRKPRKGNTENHKSLVIFDAFYWPSIRLGC